LSEFSQQGIFLESGIYFSNTYSKEYI